MLTARDAVPDIVKGLDVGADDYLTKPFAFEVFLARSVVPVAFTGFIGFLGVNGLFHFNRMWGGATEIDSMYS